MSSEVVRELEQTGGEIEVCDSDKGGWLDGEYFFLERGQF